jgi:hypothetical protein
MGIEPTSDSGCRSTVLKTAAPTRTQTPPAEMYTWARADGAVVRLDLGAALGARPRRAKTGVDSGIHADYSAGGG